MKFCVTLPIDNLTVRKLQEHNWRYQKTHKYLRIWIVNAFDVEINGFTIDPTTKFELRVLFTIADGVGECLTIESPIGSDRLALEFDDYLKNYGVINWQISAFVRLKISEHLNNIMKQ